MERYICIHGHFYQPPRENPGLEGIEIQDSAYPYHDWNERVAAECYEPNSVSRILNGQGRIVRIVNNYRKISFNFGPTLLAWLKPHAPEVYQAILQADRESQKTFSGHGSAQAQAYNHIILPLANRRDKYTQIFWGIRDFEYHFGRPPEGMWLPEMAVDLETLDTMAELGIRFTLLSPEQAQRVRPLGSAHWEDVFGGEIDPTMAYWLRLPSGREIALFFRHGPLSQAVAFEGLLRSGGEFARRLLEAFSLAQPGAQLVHIATDGETYGHHHPFGDMALAYALDYIQSRNLARLTNYGEFLEKNPPTHEVDILENTSWSCPHGVERWRADCGCSPGTHPGWSQAWRAPLREALDWLQDTLSPKYEEQAAQLFGDPWAARNDYVQVILERSPESLERFLAHHARHPLDRAEVVTALKLLEMQRHSLLMFTSCGWFFEDISGIEALQVLQYAGRALQLAQEVLGTPLEAPFVQRLERAKSNLPEYGDGRQIYQQLVKPAMVDLPKVVAHYSMCSLFEEYGPQARVYCYLIDREDYQSYEAGKARLAVGRVRCTSQVTGESAALSFAGLHFGDHNLNAGVRDYPGEEAYRQMAQEVSQAFLRADFPQALRLLDRHFGPAPYYLKSLFKDEQRQVLGRILESPLAKVEAEYRYIYESYYPLMLFLGDLGIHFPKAFSSAADFILNTDLRRAFSSGGLDSDRIQGLLGEARAWGVSLDSQGLAHELGQTLGRMMGKFASTPEDLSLLRSVLAAVSLARSMPFTVNLWKAQNLYFEVLGRTYPLFRERARQGDPAAQEWLNQFSSLAEQLSIQAP